MAEPIVVDAINIFCKDYVIYCCVEAPVTSVSQSAPNYLNSITIGTGYPIEVQPDEVWALLYATMDSSPGNLCDYVKTQAKRRRKRQVDLSSSLSQDTLLNAINTVESNITAAAESVGSGVKSISAAKATGEDSGANRAANIPVLLVGLAFTTCAFLKELLTINM
jgi:hypothetical protein